jgi:cardiolipin-specific phospholipase
MFKSFFGGALISQRQKGEEWGYVARLWLRTSSTLAFDAEQELLKRFLPEARRANIWVDIPKYGVQSINTYILEKKEAGGEKEEGAQAKSAKGRTKESAILLTHGYGGGAGMFYNNLPTISQRSTNDVYAIDWLGMGRSSRPTSGIMSGEGYPQRSFFSRKQAEDVSDECIDFFVQSLEKWREEMQINKLQLVGHSMGGYLSTFYALKYPHRVERLVLLSPVGVPELPKESEENQPEFVKKRPYFTSFIGTMWKMNVTPQSVVRAIGPWGQKMVNSLVQRRFNARGILKEDECEIISEYLYHINVDKPSGEYALNALLVPVMKTDHPGVYARKPLAGLVKELPPDLPVIFMYGDRDWMFHPQVNAIVRNMANAQLKIIEQAGHNVFMDNPGAVNKELTNILI